MKRKVERRAALAAVLVGVAIVLSCSTPGYCETSLADLVFGQADWYDSDGNMEEANSLWGKLAYSYTPDSEVYYLNVTATTTLGGQESWVIQNAPLLPTGDEYSSPRRESIDINLEDFGLTSGQDWNQVYYSYSLDTSIRTTAPLAPTTSSSVSNMTYKFGWNDGPSGPPAGPHAPPAGVKNDSPVVSHGRERRLGIVNEDVGSCTAGAFGRSLDWLNGKYKWQQYRTAQGFYAELREAGVSTPGTGTARETNAQWIKAKDTVARRLSATGPTIITKVWDPAGLIGPIDGVPVMKGNFWEWLKSEYDHGEDVEVVYRKETTGKSHMVTISGWELRQDGTMYAYFQDDKAANGYDIGAGDMAERKRAEIRRVDGGGWYFGDSETTVRFGVSESAPEPCSLVALGSALLGLAGLRRRKHV